MLLTPKKKYRVRLTYADGSRLYVHGLKPDLTSWLFSKRADAMLMNTAKIAARVKYEVERAVRYQPTTSQYAEVEIEGLLDTKARR